MVRAGEYEEKFAVESYNSLVLKYPNLNKNNWIVFSKLSLEEMKKLQKDYAIGSYFDRQDSYQDSYNDTGWEIGSKRKICKVGAFHIDKELKLCVLYRVNRDVIPYIVTREIIGKAEELGIKDVDDQNTLPTKDSMIKYMEFIKFTRMRVK